MKKALLMLPLLLVLGCTETKSVFFVGLEDGAVVKSPLKIKFGLTGMELHPKETKLDCKTCGHHHLLVDVDPVELGKLIPNDPAKGYYHYGAAETEATLELTPGEHKITMQFADGAHISYGLAMAKTIKITVEK